MNRVLNASLLPSSLAHNFTVFEDFDRPNGKFGDTLGNIALLDCKYAPVFFETTYISAFNNLVESEPFYFLLLAEAHKTIKQQLERMDFCNYAMTIGGTVEGQVEIYTGSK